MASTPPGTPSSSVVAPCREGILGWLWSLIGSTTPAYAGTGQPVPGRGGGGWFAATPTYQVAPVADPAPASDGGGAAADGSGDGSAPGAIAIVIHRD